MAKELWVEVGEAVGRWRLSAEEVVGRWRWRGWWRSYLGVLSEVEVVVSEVEVVADEGRRGKEV
ncbi:hypothetical protein Hdeb2414_s0019g00543021 [Helianthus debilis subsp. tardiflorus]